MHHHPHHLDKPANGQADAITVADALERLEEDFWKGKIRTSAAKRTWDRLKDEVDRLPAATTLTMDLLVAVGEKQEPGSRTRQEFLRWRSGWPNSLRSMAQSVSMS